MALVVINIEYLETTDDYVYDLETEDGTFAASSTPEHKDILCKNTDSCYVAFDLDKEKYTNEDGVFDEVAYMKEIFDISKEVANSISSKFKFPIKLAFEKVMFPFFLYRKKRYAYKEWLNPNVPNNVEYKGLSMIRRDFCPYIKTVCDRIFRLLMSDINTIKNIKINKNNTVTFDETIKDDYDRLIHTSFCLDINKLCEGNEFVKKRIQNIAFEHKVAILYTRSAIIDLLINDSVPVNELVISKSLKNTYKVKKIDVKWTNGLCGCCYEQKKKGTRCSRCERCNDPSHGIKKFFKTKEDKQELKECDMCKQNFLDIPHPHVSVGNRLKALDPINGPKPPDRIPYVFIRRKGWEDMKQYEFCYHPTEIKNTKDINYLYYFVHQLETSIVQIFSVLEDDPTKLYEDILTNCVNRYGLQKSIRSVDISVDEEDYMVLNSSAEPLSI